MDVGGWIRRLHISMLGTDDWNLMLSETKRPRMSIEPNSSYIVRSDSIRKRTFWRWLSLQSLFSWIWERR